MIRVPTFVSHSPINGLGLFAACDIKKGDLVWSFEENFDHRYTDAEYEALSQGVKDYMAFYGYKYSKDGFYYLPVDNDRFVNHAEDANTYDAEDGNIYASRDIKEGEEITLNYQEFDCDWRGKLGLDNPHEKSQMEVIAEIMPSVEEVKKKVRKTKSRVLSS
ncbi:MAG: SET domain-containing protein [Alphaproteobacteria bacterium]